jgi:hypothetical protein
MAWRCELAVQYQKAVVVLSQIQGQVVQPRPVSQGVLTSWICLVSRPHSNIMSYNLIIIADMFYPFMMVTSCMDASHNVSAALPESSPSQGHRMNNNTGSHEDAIKPYNC